MHKKLLSRIFALVLFSLLQCLALAQDGAKEQQTPLLSPKDSVLLLIENGKKFIQHPIKSKQTLFSIAKYYGLSLAELYEHNPSYQTNPELQTGAKLKIPIPNKAIKRYKKTGFIKSKNAAIYYIVKQGDNLFHICKRNFDMDPDTIISRNRLKNNEIKPGQRLHVGWIGTEGIPAEWRPVRKTTQSDILKGKFDKEKQKRENYDSQGVCFWPQESKENGDLYALHREARIGSIIEIFNPMGSHRVYAKVIGRIPDGYERNIEVIASPEACRKLGSKDPRFFVKVKYLK
jgi:LysM repeat protein